MHNEFIYSYKAEVKIDCSSENSCTAHTCAHDHLLSRISNPFPKRQQTCETAQSTTWSLQGALVRMRCVGVSSGLIGARGLSEV